MPGIIIIISPSFFTVGAMGVVRQFHAELVSVARPVARHNLCEVKVHLCLLLATQQWKRKKVIPTGLTRRHPLAAKIPANPKILNKGRV